MRQLKQLEVSVDLKYFFSSLSLCLVSNLESFSCIFCPIFRNSLMSLPNGTRKLIFTLQQRKSMYFTIFQNRLYIQRVISQLGRTNEFILCDSNWNRNAWLLLYNWIFLRLVILTQISKHPWKETYFCLCFIAI